MKKKAFMLLGLLATVSLTSCRITYVSSKTVTAPVYSLFNKEVDSSRTISFEVLNEKELLPYLTVTSYLSLYDGYLKDGYKFELHEDSSDAVVLVDDPDGNTIYYVDFSPTYKSVMVNGDFSSAFVFDKDYSKSSLYALSDTKYEIAKEPTTLRTFSYSNLGFNTLRKGGVNYYPLSLLECAFAPYSNVHHLYNYSRIVQYSEYEELTDTTYKVDGEDLTAFKEMKRYITNHLQVMPLYLREDRRASFLFTLENQYGLKFTRNISSMRAYLQKQDFYDDFLSENNEKRNEAYYKTFALLDDGHTSIRDHADFAWMEGEFNQYGSKMSHIISVRQTLSNQRTLAPGEVYYSTDEKLAFFTFDSFTFAENAYQEDGTTLKTDLSDYHSENYDTFFYFIRLLNEIKTKGGVEDVVIDISTNGGGVLGVMMELITLLAKGNSSDIYIETDLTGLVQKMTTKVDADNNGVFNDFDVFGNDFKFYILTSEFSFSCGNAFPFFLKKNNIATIIGQKSGGGECAVSESYLPSGEHYYHSGHIHIGWYEEGLFEGDEPGVEVDKIVNYEDFYNLDKLQTLIK